MKYLRAAKQLFLAGAVAIAFGWDAAASTTVISPFGLKLGEATPAELQAQLGPKVTLEDRGVNEDSGGREFVANKGPLGLGIGLGIDGLKGVRFRFDPRGRLVAVDMMVEKDRFNELVGIVESKYGAPVQRSVPEVGDKFARFAGQNGTVIVQSRHLATVANVNYATKEYERFMRDKQAKAKARDSDRRADDTKRSEQARQF